MNPVRIPNAVTHQHGQTLALQLRSSECPRRPCPIPCTTPISGGSARPLVFGLDVVAEDPPRSYRSSLPTNSSTRTTSAFRLLRKPFSRCTTHYALWAEGLAEFVSTAVVPGATDDLTLPPSHVHDPTHPTFEDPSRSVSLVKVMPAICPRARPRAHEGSRLGECRRLRRRRL